LVEVRGEESKFARFKFEGGIPSRASGFNPGIIDGMPGIGGIPGLKSKPGGNGSLLASRGLNCGIELWELDREVGRLVGKEFPEFIAFWKFCMFWIEFCIWSEFCNDLGRFASEAGSM